MFKVLLLKQIHGCFAAASSEDKYVQREFDLPFPPYPGLKILTDDEEIGFKEVYWEPKESRFKCYSDDDKTLYDEAMNDRQGGILRGFPKERVMAVVEPYLKAGWTLRD